MPEDTVKPIAPVGAQLKTRRQALRLSLAQIELDTKIRGKFLTKLEAGDYTALPNDIYSRGFVQHYANYLGLDGQLLAAMYVAERGGLPSGETKAPRLGRQRRLVITGRLVGFALIGVVVVSILGYLVTQFSSLAAPPRLTLTSPAADETLSSSTITISGTTTPGSDVSVNDSEIISDANGGFSDTLALQDGLNTLRIVSRSKLGKVTVVTRHVIAHLPAVTAAGVSVPSAPFAGVAVAVKVTGGSTGIIVTADGKQVWSGPFIDGAAKLFTAASDIQVTTGDAGITSVTVTNSVAAGKTISPLGHEGEIRRNQDFSSTTVIP